MNINIELVLKINNIINNSCIKKMMKVLLIQIKKNVSTVGKKCS